jgi:hypothetical protein
VHLHVWCGGKAPGAGSRHVGTATGTAAQALGAATCAAAWPRHDAAPGGRRGSRQSCGVRFGSSFFVHLFLIFIEFKVFCE